MAPDPWADEKPPDELLSKMMGGRREVDYGNLAYTANS